MHKARLENVLSNMEQSSLTQMIISDPATIFYLTGKWFHPGERLLALYLNLNGNHKLFINELFPCPEDLGVEKVWFKDTDQPIKIMAEYIQKDSTLGIDKNWPSRFLISLMELKAASSYVNGSIITDRVRMIKDNEEINLMEDASSTNDVAMERVINSISNLYTEKDMVKSLLNIYQDLNTQGPSFSPIIAYGANGSDPHHSSDMSKLKEGDSIIIDIGCRKASYCSDMTRTVFYKAVSDKAREVYNIVKEANQRAIDTVKPGARFSDIDKAARDYIEAKSYGKYFTHRTGHSIGIEVHDFGDVSAVNNDEVAPGMIFSIEPGIYLPGEFGVRIEDLVMVTQDGCKVLNNYTKELTIVG